ncbi:MAG: hypothetical protein BWY89_01158 [Bacteroidetes bacterium ADurb.BinA012]|nr:MAG: hypothetical protein BWY89_01158 [Bacteroidetes bacterium ADurb.BinA012]
MAAPVITPVQPKGMNGFQFSGLMKKSPSIMKNRITASLMKTIMLLTFALSFMPITSRVVIMPTIISAGRLNGGAHIHAGMIIPNPASRFTR